MCKQNVALGHIIMTLSQLFFPPTPNTEAKNANFRLWFDMTKNGTHFLSH